MFTGIVEQMGRVVEMGDNGHVRRLVIAARGLNESAIGASVAVNGVCLTVVATDGDKAALDVIAETLDRTNLGSLGPGEPVNVELAMPGTGRFEGHLVQGHVDGTGLVSAVTEDERGTVMTIRPESRLLRHIAEKGSITIDGVSLTVVSVSDETFTVALIPHTLQITTLGLRKPGDVVNLETDVIAKYLERLLEERR